jgi:hypothetical protein
MRVAGFIMAMMILAGCDKKPEEFAFECTIFDAKLNTPVNNASVNLLVQRADGGFNPNFESVGTATTNANGKFYLEVDKEVFYAYRLDVSHSEHFSQSFEIDPDDVPFSSAYEATFEVEPRAWIATHLINQNVSQTANFAVVSDNDNCSECCTGGTTYVQGFTVDTTFVCPVYGEQQVTISGSYTDGDGGVHQILETTFVPAFDTAIVTIIY